MLSIPKECSAVTVACGISGTGQTVVMSVLGMLIVGGTVLVKNRLGAGRGEVDRKEGWKRRKERGWEEGSRGMEKEGELKENGSAKEGEKRRGERKDGGKELNTYNQ